LKKKKKTFTLRVFKESTQNGLWKYNNLTKVKSLVVVVLQTEREREKKKLEFCGCVIDVGRKHTFI
jgi:hypothetical protein